jgi:NADPH:quinone reductase-like Zn-dependent oxidoreductase
VKAIVCTRYGPPEVLRLQDAPIPHPKRDEVLFRVRAAAVSDSDCATRGGRVKPLMWLPFRIFVGFRRPRHAVLGLELSGEIEAVGSEITRFKPGQSILAFTGNRFGAYAEYVCLRDGGKYIPFNCVIASKPPGISHAEAATVPTRATLALYFLKKAKIENSQKVLIYGASGGIGTFAVQLAKLFGAQVTALCSAANIGLVKSLGADRVLDYTNHNGSDVGGPFDIVFDAAGARKSSPLKIAVSGRARRSRAEQYPWTRPRGSRPLTSMWCRNSLLLARLGLFLTESIRLPKPRMRIATSRPDTSAAAWRL